MRRSSGQGYKSVGDIDSRYDNEKRMDSLSLPPTDFAREEESVDLGKIEKLEHELDYKSGKPFQIAHIERVYNAFEAVGIEHVLPAHVERFLSRMPGISSDLELSRDTFRTLAFLSQRSEFAKMIEESRILDKINYTKFAAPVVRRIHREICLLLYHVIQTCPSTAEFFYERFFQYYMRVVKDPSVYDDLGLDALLDVGTLFIDFLNRNFEDIGPLLRFYLRFIHHTDGDISSRAIEGTILLIRKLPDVSIPELDNPEQRMALCDRLTYLGGQKNNDLCQSVVLLLSFMLRKFTLTPQCYISMAGMIKTCMTYDTVLHYSRRHVLGLLANCIGTTGFSDAVQGNVLELIYIFIDNYPGFRLDEKIEASFVFANVINFLPGEVVCELFQSDQFFSALLDVLDLVDENAGVDSIMDALHWQISRHGVAMLGKQRTEELISALHQVEEAYSGARTQRAAAMVLSLLTVE